MKKNVILFGDSWAMGEWQKPLGVLPHLIKLTHRGLQSYLERDGHIVANLSIAGAGNRKIIQHFTEQIDRYETDDADIIFVQTDPIRDCIDSNSERWWSDKQTPAEFKEQQFKKQKQCYELLANLPYKIYCIGGCHPLNLDLIKQFDNLVPVMTSMMQELAPDQTIPTVWRSDNWTDHIDQKYISKAMLDFICEEERLREELPRDYFWPDGWHPNRYGYEIIYDKLKSNIIFSS